MSKDWKCSLCNKRFHQKKHGENHARDYHKKKDAGIVHAPRTDNEPSMADLMVNAEINRACGDPVDDYLLDMLPD